MERIKSIFRFPVVLAILHYMLTIVNGRNYFDYSQTKDIFLISLVEILTFLFLLAIYQFIFKIVKEHKKYRQHIRIFLIYFFILLLLLILIWPGNWRQDDLVIATITKKFNVLAWQHTLSSIFYMVSLKIFPFPTGVLIIQIILISMLVTPIINKMYSYFSIDNRMMKGLCYIPFLLPATLDNNLYPMRSTLYSYLFIFTIFLIITYINEKNKITLKQIISLIFLFSILSVWRSEGIFFLVICIVVAVYFKKCKQLVLKDAFLLCFGTIVFSFSMMALHQHYMVGNLEHNYKITSTVETIAHLVRRATSKNENAHLLEKINRVINNEMILSQPKTDGVELYWQGLVREGYTDNEFKDYMASYYKLCAKYPDIFINERINEFLQTSALDDISVSKGNLLYDSSSGFDNLSKNKDSNYAKLIQIGGNIEKPFNKGIRKNIMRILEGRKMNNFYKPTFIYSIFWNLIPPLIFTFIFVVYCIIKKKIMIAFLISTSLMKAVLVFLTAPSALFMYYFSEYIIGYTLLIVLIMLCYKKYGKEVKRV